MVTVGVKGLKYDNTCRLEIWWAPRGAVKVAGGQFFTPVNSLPCTKYTVSDEKSWGNVVLGSRFGLSLTLNIEQYEYMIGPQSDAGIKVSQTVAQALWLLIKLMKYTRL